MATLFSQKTEVEKEDERAQELVHRKPKAKPPREDLRRHRVRHEDPDVPSGGKVENDPDLSLNYKKVAGAPPRAGCNADSYKRYRGDKEGQGGEAMEYEDWLSYNKCSTTKKEPEKGTPGAEKGQEGQEAGPDPQEAKRPPEKGQEGGPREETVRPVDSFPTFDSEGDRTYSDEEISRYVPLDHPFAQYIDFEEFGKQDFSADVLGAIGKHLETYQRILADPNSAGRSLESMVKGGKEAEAKVEKGKKSLTKARDSKKEAVKKKLAEDLGFVKQSVDRVRKDRKVAETELAGLRKSQASAEAVIELFPETSKKLGEELDSLSGSLAGLTSMPPPLDPGDLAPREERVKEMASLYKEAIDRLEKLNSDHESSRSTLDFSTSREQELLDRLQALSHEEEDLVSGVDKIKEKAREELSSAGSSLYGVDPDTIASVILGKAADRFRRKVYLDPGRGLDDSGDFKSGVKADFASYLDFSKEDIGEVAEGLASSLKKGTLPQESEGRARGRLSALRALHIVKGGDGSAGSQAPVPEAAQEAVRRYVETFGGDSYLAMVEDGADPSSPIRPESRSSFRELFDSLEDEDVTALVDKSSPLSDLANILSGGEVYTRYDGEEVPYSESQKRFIRDQLKGFMLDDAGIVASFSHAVSVPTTGGEKPSADSSPSNVFAHGLPKEAADRLFEIAAMDEITVAEEEEVASIRAERMGLMEPVAAESLGDDHPITVHLRAIRVNGNPDILDGKTNPPLLRNGSVRSQSYHPRSSRRTPMPETKKKITASGARRFSADLDKLATFVQKNAEAIGVPQKIADDFAFRADWMSDRAEKAAGVSKKADFNAETIGDEKKGPIEGDSDEAFMDGHFTQGDLDELRTKQEGGDIGKDASTRRRASSELEALKKKLASTEAQNTALRKRVRLLSVAT